MNIFTLIIACAFPNMERRCFGISNPNYTDPVKFSTQYYDINSTTEYFEVYSPVITSQYAMFLDNDASRASSRTYCY